MCLPSERESGGEDFSAFQGSVAVADGKRGEGRGTAYRSEKVDGLSPRVFISPASPRHAGTTCGAPENTSVLVMAVLMAVNTSCGS